MTGRTEACGCGCCTGVEPVTPVAVTNRPGLDAVAYRVGTHAQFLETMIARLSTELVAGSRPLATLTTRASGDPALAFLDGCAAVADVLSFYQERIANEGFLRCATEDRSIRELGRLVGYAPRPGVAATTYLSYTIDNGAQVTIPAGSRVQSLPGPGELPQTFETTDDLAARGDWNILAVRRTHGGQGAVLAAAAQGASAGADSDGPPSVYFAGITTGLNPGDPLLVDFSSYQELLRVLKVTPEPAANRTRVALQRWLPPIPAAEADADSSVPGADEVADLVARHADPAAFGVDPARVTAADVVDLLERVRTNLMFGMDGPELHEFLRQVVVPALHAKLRDLGSRQGPLSRWIRGLVADLDEIAVRADAAQRAGDEAAAPVAAAVHPPDGGATTIGNALSSLAKPASVPPAGPRQLVRKVNADFAVGSDVLPGLLTALRPELGANLYQAWRAAPVTPASTARCYALRQRAAVFGATAAPEPVRNRDGVLTGTREWQLTRPDGAAVEEFEVVVALPVGRILDPNPNDQLTVDVRIGSGPGALGTSASFRVLDVLEGPRSVPFPQAGEELVVELRGPGVSPFTPAALTVTFVNRAMVFVSAMSPNDAPCAQLEWSSTGSDPTDVAYIVETDGERGPSSTSVRVRITGSRPGGGVIATESPATVSLDTTYPAITPGGWVVLDRPGDDPGTRALVIARADGVREEGRTDYGTVGRSTLVDLDRDWLDLDTDTFAVIRGTSVFARSELLEPAEAPLDPVEGALCGGEIPLTDLYDGLTPGRWLVVSGERTDVTAARTGGSPPGVGPDVAIAGVPAAELTMIGGVRQDFDPAEPDARTRTTLLLATPLAYCYRRDTVQVSGNVVKATHGETTAEVLGSGDGTQANQTFALARRPLTYVSAPTDSGVASTLAVTVDGVRWNQADSLLDVPPTAHDFVVRTSPDGVPSVTFGDGTEGARLPTGPLNVAATYRFGIGKVGNLDADRLTLPTTRPQGVMTVTNTLRASGGADRESGAASRRRIPLGVTALDRVVATTDYRDFALGFAGIGKAEVALLGEGRTRLVHLTVAGEDDLPLDPTSDAVVNLRRALARFGDPYQPFRVEVRTLLALVIDARVALDLDPDRQWDAVEPKIRATLLDRFGFAQRDLAQDVGRGEVVAAIQRVPGVRYVDLDLLDAFGEGTVRQALTDPSAAGLGSGLRLLHRVVAHPARLAGTPKRIVPAELAVLLPDAAAATLRLTEIIR